MLHGTGLLSELEVILHELRAYPAGFYLTGSRAFHAERSTSDYDFYTADDPDTEAFLLKLGFTELKKSDYKLDDTSKVMHHKTGTGIDVQLVTDVFLKTKVQDILKVFLSLDQYPRSRKTLKTYWNAVYRELLKEVN